VEGKPSYKFMEVLEMIDFIQEWEHLTVLMDVLEYDQKAYTNAQQASIGTKLKEKFIILQYGRTI
jgi:hypothetical protein